MMMAGLPPFSGFFGKLFILQATANHPQQGIIIASLLIVSLLSIIAFVRVGFILFWRATTPEMDPREIAFEAYKVLPETAPVRNDKTLYLLLLLLILYVVFAAPIQRYNHNTALQIQNDQAYTDTILKRGLLNQVISVKPYDASYVPETKYGGENKDRNANLIPFMISENTLEGGHISEYKWRQIQQQHSLEPAVPEDAQLKPMEP